MERRRYSIAKPTIKGSIQQRQPDGSIIGIEFAGKIQTMLGPIEKVAEVVLEAEMHGNDGKSRIHLWMQ